MQLSLDTFMPHVRHVRVDHVAIVDAVVTIRVSSVQPSSSCPLCHQVSSRVHSRYERRVADLPWSGCAVVLRVRARKFFCPNAACVRTVFCERLPDLVAVWARRTHNLGTYLRSLGFALGGRPGARLAAKHGVATSRTTVLRLVRTTPLADVPTPRVLGVDDWSRRRGLSYGTILIDLERHRPVDLLPDRTADTFASWLAAHEGIEIISRDRGGAYAEGARRGAPQTRQVADRWHLQHNLRTAIGDFLTRKQAYLRDAATVTMGAQAQETLDPASPHAVQPTPLSRTAQRQRERLEQRQAQFAEVRALYASGLSQRAVARALGLSRDTVARSVQADAVPSTGRRAPRTPLCAPFIPYLQMRWGMGCHEAATLWREIRARGYTGSQSGLRAFLRRWRTMPGRPGARSVHTLPQDEARPMPPVRLQTTSPRQAMWLLLRADDDLAEMDRAFVAALCTAHADVAAVRRVGLAFLSLLHNRDQAGLEDWLASAETSGIREVQGFAAGLRKDRDAIEAALSMEWSQGQTEGFVNKLKLLKRQGYGRANLDLLRQRILYAA